MNKVTIWIENKSGTILLRYEGQFWKNKYDVRANSSWNNGWALKFEVFFKKQCTYVGVL